MIKNHYIDNEGGDEMVKITEMLIPKSNKRTRPGIKRRPRSITIHETDNEKVGANALAHARLQANGNPRLASWHIQVDDREAYVSIPYDEVAYAAGDGKGPGNMYSIHIEMCVNRDSDYQQTVANTVDIVRSLLKKYPSITKVVQHYEWSGKNCPRYLRSGTKRISWTAFLQKVEMKNGSSIKLSPTLVVDGYLGPLTIQALQRYFGTPVDGVISRPSTLIHAMQKWLKTPQDGIISEPYSTMVAALQRRYHTPVDGKISKPSTVIKVLQRKLNEGKL